ncbi:MucR family transcriptional regulator [Mailhella massiliensis]|uniref:MucR family transcriptional regulator n=1 Tax=Mailhella massiliensis TaxID=1903261 RepID=A0A921AV41_9BACT|nr:MucR family transcriptional regulator [Mailhella massiliensis]HJD96419.1 MucR family transcriptional regulator [Mailhella massiliensis]
MDEYTKKALEIVKAQAGISAMTEEEIFARISRLSELLRRMEENHDASPPAGKKMRRPLREKSILCLECGRSFRMITRRHLAAHGLEPEEYREKWGLEKNAPLICRALRRLRCKAMLDLRLWEKRAPAREKAASPPEEER